MEIPINTPPKEIPLHQTHLKLGAQMVPFAGFMMPVRYSSDIEEHLSVRKNVGVFDVSHMGEFRVKGKEALNLIQWISSNDASVLSPGKAQYTCMPNEKGGIVDDMLVYKLAEEEYLLVVNAGNIEKDWEWINSQNTFEAKLSNESEDWCLFAVQGPLAIEVIQKISQIKLKNIPYYQFEIGRVADIDQVIISNTGYTGAGGFELYVNKSNALQLWEALFKAGKEYDIKPIGLGARDTLRLEMGFCLYGNDINDHTSPLEAGLGWVTKLHKACVNHEYLVAQKTNGVSKKLIGFKMLERAIPRAHYKIFNAQKSDPIGEVCSGTQSPSLGYGIGMAYVASEFSKQNTEILVEVRDKKYKAEIVKPPFFK
jgi:aminomethyltransferase